MTFQVRPKRCFQGIFLLRWFDGAFQSCSSKTLKKQWKINIFRRVVAVPGRKMSPKNVTSPPKNIQKPMKKHDFLPIGVHKKNWTLKWTFFAKIFKFFNFGRMSSAAPSAPAGFRLRVLVVCSLHVSMRVDGHCHLQGPPTQISGPPTVRTHGPRLF